MRLLVVTPEAPAPRHVNGGATRQFRLLRRLIELGHEVTVVAAFPWTDAPYEDALRADGFTVIASRRPRSRLLELIRAVARRPSLLLAPLQLSVKELIAAMIWVDLRPLARKALRDGSYDAVLIEFESAQSWIGDLASDTPFVLTLHEFESSQFFAKADRIGGFAGRLRRINARRALAGERRWIPRYDAVVTMSPDETALLDAAVADHPPAFAIGNGADRAAFELPLPSAGGRRVIFAGTMLFPPNRIGADWLAREVWPDVLTRVPEATLEIVGRSPSVATKSLGDLPGVTVVADAPEMIPHLAAADVYAIPMLEGGGTRLKFAEAMASGRAIVTTTNGATGFDIVHGHDALIADDPRVFAEAIVNLLTTAELRDRIGLTARRHASGEYEWDQLGNKLAVALAELVSSPEQPGDSKLLVAEA